MVSSGGGGGGRSQGTQNAATPPGNILQPSGSYQPNFTSFLPNDGSMATGLTPEMLAAVNTPPPPPPPQQQAAGGMGGPGGMDAFAQQLMDYQKNQRLGQYAMNFGPQGRAYGMSQMGAPAPQPQGATQQLMASMMQRNQLAGMMGGARRNQSSR